MVCLALPRGNLVLRFLGGTVFDAISKGPLDSKISFWAPGAVGQTYSLKWEFFRFEIRPIGLLNSFVSHVS